VIKLNLSNHAPECFGPSEAACPVFRKLHTISLAFFLWRIVVVFLIISPGGCVNVMDGNHCNRCGRSIPEGSLKYHVAVRVRSMFDGVIPHADEDDPGEELSNIMADMSACSEEELNRQVYEDDAFVMCPRCKEEFLKDIYSHIRPKDSPKGAREHLIH